MWRLILVLSLVVSACAPALADEAKSAHVAEVTRLVEVTRIVEVVVTATPTPQPPPEQIVLVPTPTPRPIPSGWSEYNVINGKLVVAYPSDWNIEKEGSNWVIFSNSLAFLQVIDSSEAAAGKVDLDTLRFLKMAFADRQPLDTVRFIDEGTLSIDRPAVYFTANRTDYVYDVLSTELYAATGEGNHQAFLDLSIEGSIIPDDLIETSKAILQNLRFVD